MEYRTERYHQHNLISLTPQQVKLVQKSWKLFRGINSEVIGDLFYSKLFTDKPGLKKMFKNPMSFQYKKLTDMVSLIVGRLHTLDMVTDDIEDLARRHVEYGVREAHYKMVGDALLWTLEQGLGKDWNKDTSQAWINCYKVLSDMMIKASGY